MKELSTRLTAGRVVVWETPFPAAKAMGHKASSGSRCVRGTFDARDLVGFIEEHDEMTAHRLREATLLEIVDVVPALILEGVRHHRRAKERTNLDARHPNGHPINILGIEEVSLLDVDAMNAASCAREAGCDQKKQGDATK
jgi:hypothetical protein